MARAVEHIKDNMSNTDNPKYQILDCMLQYCNNEDTVTKVIAKKIIEVALQRRYWGMGQTSSAKSFVTYLNN